MWAKGGFIEGELREGNGRACWGVLLLVAGSMVVLRGVYGGHRTLNLSPPCTLNNPVP